METLETLRAHGLLDKNGKPTSVGSWPHDSGSCKPCVAAYTGHCAAGIFCTCCHMPHNRAAITKQKNKSLSMDIPPHGLKHI